MLDVTTANINWQSNGAILYVNNLTTEYFTVQKQLPHKAVQACNY